jgi:hypothetical protein
MLKRSLQALKVFFYRLRREFIAFVRRCIAIVSRSVHFLKSIDTLAWATITLALATISLAVIAVLQWNALDKTDETLRKTLVASNRAWISVDGAAADGDIGGDKDVVVQVFYANVGKGPAIGLNQAFNAGTTPNVSKSDFEAVPVGPNNTCNGLAPLTNGFTVFPNASTVHRAKTTIFRKLILPSVQTNDGAVFLQGCLSYETMHETHFTWFCLFVYRNGRLATAGLTEFCKDGNGAD